MKIIAAGDPTQLGYLANVNKNFYSYNVDAINAIFTPRLWSSVRSSNGQKRLNNDRYIRIVREIEKIYKNSKGYYDKAAEDSLRYLRNNVELNTLSYFEAQNDFAGDKIVTALNKEIVTTIKSQMDKNPEFTLGVLTEDGKLPEDWNTLLSEVGLITPEDTSRIKIFTPSNIQGSEVDYFIFDANLIKKYDKIRDQLKAFYTFMSRSKVGSFIIDSSNILSNLNIFNGKKDLFPSNFELMTPEVIKNAKEKRIEDLKKLLGENLQVSDYDNFK